MAGGYDWGDLATDVITYYYNEAQKQNDKQQLVKTIKSSISCPACPVCPKCPICPTCQNNMPQIRGNMLILMIIIFIMIIIIVCFYKRIKNRTDSISASILQTNVKASKQQIELKKSSEQYKKGNSMNSQAFDKIYNSYQDHAKVQYKIQKSLKKLVAHKIQKQNIQKQQLKQIYSIVKQTQSRITESQSKIQQLNTNFDNLAKQSIFKKFNFNRIKRTNKIKREKTENNEAVNDKKENPEINDDQMQSKKNV